MQASCFLIECSEFDCIFTKSFISCYYVVLTRSRVTQANPTPIHIYHMVGDNWRQWKDDDNGQ